MNNKRAAMLKLNTPKWARIDETVDKKSFFYLYKICLIIYIFS